MEVHNMAAVLRAAESLFRLYVDPIFQEKFKFSKPTVCIHSSHTALQTYWSARQKNNAHCFTKNINLYPANVENRV